MSGKPGSADVPVGMGAGNASEGAGGPRGWYSRGYLPHRDRPYLIHAVTYRLADSLPQAKLEMLKQTLALLPEDERALESRRRRESWLDAGMGCCALACPEVARFVQDSLLCFHGKKYQLHAWCIMPNHVHILVEPVADMASIIQDWKSFTARWILRQDTRLGLGLPDRQRLWMREYWDRYIRDQEHYQKTVDYIHQNPVKAGLCPSPGDWPWSSYGMSAAPGSADTPGSADILVGRDLKHASKDAGAPRAAKQADGDVGAPRKTPPQ